MQFLCFKNTLKVWMKIIKIANKIKHRYSFDILHIQYWIYSESTWGEIYLQHQYDVKGTAIDRNS